MTDYAFAVLARGVPQSDESGLELMRIRADLPDRESARSFAIEMAERILHEQGGERIARSSFITISDEEGNVLDTIRSVCV